MRKHLSQLTKQASLSLYEPLCESRSTSHRPSCDSRGALHMDVSARQMPKDISCPPDPHQPLFHTNPATLPVPAFGPWRETHGSSETRARKKEGETTRSFAEGGREKLKRIDHDRPIGLEVEKKGSKKE